MKKRLSTIFLLLILALTFVTLGCPGAEPLDLSKVKKWNDLQSLADKDLVQCIKLENDTDVAIDWWIITDTDGMVLECGKDYWIVDDEGKNPSNAKPATLTVDGKLYLKFEKTDDVVVWIHQNIAPKDVEKGEVAVPGSKDFRGRVNIEKSQGFEVKASKYREEVSQVGIINLTCDETRIDNANPDGLVKGNWHGNYRITEVWPLSQKKNSPEWEATEGLKFIFDDPIEEGESRRLVYPADVETVIALKQPDRFTDADDKDKIEAQKNWYWCLPFCKESTIQIANDPDTDTKAPVYKTLVPHEEVAVKSSDCVFYFKLGAFYKSAMGENYVVEEFVSSSEK